MGCLGYHRAGTRCSASPWPPFRLSPLPLTVLPPGAQISCAHDPALRHFLPTAPDLRRPCLLHFLRVPPAGLAVWVLRASPSLSSHPPCVCRPRAAVSHIPAPCWLRRRSPLTRFTLRGPCHSLNTCVQPDRLRAGGVRRHGPSSTQ